jgi:hypothetical protein
MIEGAGAPNMRVAMQAPFAGDLNDAMVYLNLRNPAMEYGNYMLGAGPVWGAISKASKKFGISPYDVSPLSGIWNEGIAKNSGMRVMMDPEGLTSGGMTLKDLLPEYTKFLGSDMPESWKAEGGSITGYAGGGRKLTRLAEEAMERLAKMRGERFQAEKSMGAGDADARRAANDVFLDPDKRLQKNYVNEPLRLAFPGIYKDPRDIASEASELALSKSPDLGKESSLYRATGLTRDDLYDYGKSDIDRLPTDIPPQMPGPRVRGSKISGNVLTDAMRQHQLDVLRESMGYSHLFKPSTAWYEMGPIWDMARDKAGLSMPEMQQLNQFMGIHSPASSPTEEMKRGLAANYFLRHGRLDDYIKYGVNTEGTKRLPGYPSDFGDVPGHFAHSTAHVPALLKAIADPDTWMQDAANIKVPHYIAATDPAGAYLGRPVADSHFARGLGFPDVRTASRGQQIMKNLTPSEFWDTVPFYDKLSSQVGLKPTQTQALQWNVMGPQTGVRQIAVPKAEIFTDIAAERARQRGVGLDEAMIDLLRGADYPRNYARGGDVDFDLYHVMNYARGGRDVDYDLYHLQDFWKK